MTYIDLHSLMEKRAGRAFLTQNTGFLPHKEIHET